LAIQLALEPRIILLLAGGSDSQELASQDQGKPHDSKPIDQRKAKARGILRTFSIGPISSR